MTTSLSINRLIQATVNLEPNAAQMQNISTLLILGSSDVINVTERYRQYDSASAVAADFGTSAPEYLAAQLWEAQIPQPLNLLIGRWAETATAAVLVGGSLSTTQKAISIWQAISDGGFFVYVDGVPVHVSGLNFTAETNLNGVAYVIQQALDAVSSGCTVTWNSDYSQFLVTSGTTGVTSTLSFLAAPTATDAVTFNANALAGDTLTLNGTVLTFVDVITGPDQVLIGATPQETVAATASAINTSADANIALIEGYHEDAGSILYLIAKLTGTAGNSYTAISSSANIVVSSPTFSGGSGTDVANLMLGTATSSGAYIANGVAAETPVEAAAIFDINFGQLWYGLMFTAIPDADHLEVASFIESTTNKHTYWVSSQEAGIISPVSTTDIASELKALGVNRTAVQYSSSTPYAVASLCAKALTVDYNGNNTVIDTMYKQEPLVTAETLNVNQLNALEAKNCNVFVAYNNNTAIIEKGNMSSGTPIDIVTGTDWLALAIQNAVYNLLYLSPTKIPQTDAGNNLIVGTITGILSQARTNGLLAPGVWSSNGFGALSNGDFLSTGFYVYAPPIASQTVADRSARKSVTFQIAAKLAGAIRTVDILINVNR
jgi:hypothetical protein